MGQERAASLAAEGAHTPTGSGADPPPARSYPSLGNLTLTHAFSSLPLWSSAWLPGPCGGSAERPAPDCQGNPCYRPVPASSQQYWCLPSSLFCKMRRTEPGEEHTSPEALDGYQTQNCGTARLLPTSFRRKSALSRGSRLALGGVLRRGCVTAGSGRWSLCPRSAAPHRRCSLLGRKPTLPVSVGAGLHPLGGSSAGQAVFPYPLAVTMGPPSWAGPVWGPAQDSGT